MIIQENNPSEQKIRKWQTEKVISETACAFAVLYGFAERAIQSGGVTQDL
jgi:hypothetical protein